MKKLAGRIGAIIIAILFLVTSLGFSFLVIWQTHQQDKQNQQQAAVQQALQQSQNQPQEGKLQGTALGGFTPISHIDKLQTIDTVAGKGEVVKPGDIVTVNYTGAVAATGTIFQSSLDSGKPIAFPLSGVIKGWTDGIPGMKVGGTRRLLIPAAEAYGANPPQGSGIPANADLVFDVQLIKIGQ